VAVDTSQVHFPFVQQIIRIDRRRELKDRCTWDQAFYVTSLSGQQASPHRLGAIVRGHWGIENQLHYRRDWSFDEDRHRTRKPCGIQVMACLRNLTVAWAGTAQYAKQRKRRRCTLPQLLNANARRIPNALSAVLKPWKKN
jgi:predicted transposase YbfD/YdcC